MLAWQAYRNTQTQAVFASHHQAASTDLPLQQAG